MSFCILSSQINPRCDQDLAVISISWFSFSGCLLAMQLAKCQWLSNLIPLIYPDHR